MELRSLLDPLNPTMALVWSFAGNQLKIIRNSRQYREVRSINIDEMCNVLNKLLSSHRGPLSSQTYYRSSMVTSGILRLHNKQTSILLEDIMKLLVTMQKEKAVMKTFDEILDCTDYHAKVTEPDVLDLLSDQADLGASPRATRPTIKPDSTILTAAAAAKARVLKVDWSTLDGDIDWTIAPPRACMQEITLPVDVGPSNLYLTELERLRTLEGSLEGPTLIDWEDEFSREGSPKAADEITVEGITEAPSDIFAPEEREQPIQSPVVKEAPIVIVEPELPAVPELLAPEPSATPLPQEQPSQIELPPLEVQRHERLTRRARRAIPLTDSVTILSNDSMRLQIQTHLGTLRSQESTEDIINIEQLKLYQVDFFGCKPLHRGVVADALLAHFHPCDSEAPIPGPESSFPVPESPFPETVRAASHVEEKELSMVPSLPQDTTSESSLRSRSTLLEAPTGIFEETQFYLQPIEEHEAVAQPPPPPPPGQKIMPVAPKAPVSPRRKRVRKEVDEDAQAVGVAPPTRETVTTKETHPKVAVPETSQEDLPLIEVEEQESSESGSSEPDDLERMILEYLAIHPEVVLNDLLPEDTTDKAAAIIFECLLRMYKNDQVQLLQDHAFGPIIVTRASSH